MQPAPAIVISAYNRPASLSRLLHALEQGVYDSGEITLVISIDKSDAKEVEALANAFAWPHGPKKIIIHAAHLGLKAHILTCGALTEIYQSIILLEDDLLVSPWFYSYAKQALAFYQHDTGIAGISLYNYQVAESCVQPFNAIDDGSDVYFMQVASSWGQLWTNAQWTAFAAWLAQNPELPQEANIPAYLYPWGQQSWKKHFIHYLIDTNRYFVFPRLSLTTNFEDAGTHPTTGLFQVPLQMAPKENVFKALADSIAVYDAWFELLPVCMSQLNAKLQGMDYTVDLYGTKILPQIKSEYVLSVRSAKEPLLSFGSGLFPLEANIAMNLQGQGIGLYALKDHVFTDHKSPLRRQLQAQQQEDRFLISVIIPVEVADASALEATLDSVVKQAYGNKSCLLITSPAAEELVKKITAQYTLSIQIVSVQAALTGLVIQGLHYPGSGLLTWAMPGSTFAEDAFVKAASVFKDNAGISWIRGVNEEFPASDYPVPDTTPYRLTAALAYQRLKNNVLNVSTELDFFRTHCIKNSDTSVSLAGLFFDLILAYKMIIVVTRLGTKKTIAPEPVSAYERHALLEGYSHFKQKNPWQKSLLSFLLKTPLFSNASRKWYGAALENLPDVLRYDPVHGTFYFHKY